MRGEYKRPQTAAQKLDSILAGNKPIVTGKRETVGQPQSKGRGQRQAEASNWSQPKPVERPVTAGIHANMRTAAPQKKNLNEEFPEFPGLAPSNIKKCEPESDEEQTEVVVAPKGKGRGKKGKGQAV